jgi:acyl-CoA dehydrogenase
MSLNVLLENLLVADERLFECEDRSTWLPFWRAKQIALAAHGPFVAAAAAAVRADRLAWAFFCGYQGAIQTTFPEQTPQGVVSAFCVNESGRKITDIETEVIDSNGALTLCGKKGWTLDGPEELQLFVLARNVAGPTKGPGSLACVRVPLQRPGVALARRQHQGPVPELAHAEVTFDGAEMPSSCLLPGDGYADYAKPFRLREDIFVTGCTLAYLLGEGHQASWPTTWAQQCIAAIAGLHTCSTLDPHRSETHVLTAGVLSGAGEVIHESEFLWGRSASDKLARWHRDLPLLSLGRDARRQRVIKSWRAIGWTVPEHYGLGDHTSGSLVV